MTDIGKMLGEALDENREGGGVLFPPDGTGYSTWTLDDRFDLDAAAKAFMAKVREAERVGEGGDT